MNLLNDLHIIGAFNKEKLKIGDELDNVIIKDTVRLNGAFTDWDDFVCEATSGRQGANLKPEYNYETGTLEFPENDQTHIAYYNIQLPHRWKEETTIFPHIHFIQNQNQTPSFTLEYKWITIGEIVPTTWSSIILGNSVKSYSSGLMHQILTNNNGINGTGKGLSSILQCKLYRNNDSYINECSVMSFDLHLQIDGFGSKEEYIK
jgi:hypothetical protein